MSSKHPFRFAAQISKPPDGAERDRARAWAEQARKVEDLGYSALLMPDHFGEQLAPVPALVAAAEATTSLRVGTLVFDNDYRHPLVLAKEAATLDLLSGGRLELGFGAGWMRSDYEQSGIPYESPGVRVDRFEEAVSILKCLLEAQEPFSYSGKHYSISDHTPYPRPAQQPRPPLIIGGGAPRVLGIAGREADIVSINVDLRAGLGGVETAPNASPQSTKQKVEWVKQAAGSRFEEIELNCLIGFVMFTDDARQIAETMGPTFGIEPADALHVPLALIGTIEEMEQELRWRREEYGISYFSVEGEAWEALGPLVSRLTGS